ncbi:MADS-box protein SOC1-like [Magnolia sinica]|uniref:MADS-box protein SOC1-like n=1 Tax=Magnolia sinica TaxID=86752 RepID=UPI00265AD69B|nr:MADS-box protein SOC1-like [Magnolia sinica]
MLLMGCTGQSRSHAGAPKAGGSCMQKTIDRYLRHSKDTNINKAAVEQNVQLWKYEAAHMSKKIEILEDSKRKLLGESLESCSIEELQHIENQLERSLKNIRGRKSQLYVEQIKQLKEKERILSEENTVLIKKCGLRPQEPSTIQREIVHYDHGTQDQEVETELYIGRPERGIPRYPLQG